MLDHRLQKAYFLWKLRLAKIIWQKVKANFKTEIKGARNERMWSQAWNPGFRSHKNSSISQPAKCHCDSQKQNCSLERQYWGKHLNAHEMISERSICQIYPPCHSCNTRTLREYQVLQVIFFTSFCPSIDLCWRVIRKVRTARAPTSDDSSIPFTCRITRIRSPLRACVIIGCSSTKTSWFCQLSTL